MASYAVWLARYGAARRAKIVFVDARREGCVLCVYACVGAVGENT